jgi:hypothetical protein
MRLSQPAGSCGCGCGSEGDCGGGGNGRTADTTAESTADATGFATGDVDGCRGSGGDRVCMVAVAAADSVLATASTGGDGRTHVVSCLWKFM